MKYLVIQGTEVDALCKGLTLEGKWSRVDEYAIPALYGYPRSELFKADNAHFAFTVATAVGGCSVSFADFHEFDEKMKAVLPFPNEPDTFEFLRKIP